MSMAKLFDLTGKVALVTGGNGGLGLAMAKGLAQAGAGIVVAARDEKKTAQALSEIRALGARAEGVVVDVTQEAQIKDMVSSTVVKLGRVDILVNNAGTTVRKEPQDLTSEEWDQVLDVNLRSAFLASREVYPHMKAQGGGKIINIGSMFSLFGGGGSGAPYSSSKGGVVQLAKSLAVAWAKDNIQCNHSAGLVHDRADGGDSRDPTRPLRPDQPAHPHRTLGSAGRVTRSGGFFGQPGLRLRHRGGANRGWWLLGYVNLGGRPSQY